MDDLGYFQFYDKYSRYMWDKGRFETFEEAVERSIDHAKYIVGDALTESEYDELRQGMLKHEAFPSMRWFQMAGEPARLFPQSIFNCSYMPIDSIEAFSEALFLLGLGVGVGYSVERHYVARLPVVQQTDYVQKIVVQDSLEGWRNALDSFIRACFRGDMIELDVSLVRPAGAPLKTRGGVASGPEPFVAALNAIKDIFVSATGRKLKPIEAHDIMCFIASAIVSGGVRRSAMISLFSKDDVEMLQCKAPSQIEGNKQRYYANNSMVIDDELDRRTWLKIFELIDEDGNGEPGIFNRFAANEMIPLRRKQAVFGTNPCGEVNLRPMQFCNLSIANVRANDLLIDMARKVRLATIWGTIMACVDNFPLLRSQWTRNQLEERLLGVDLNGVNDNTMFHETNPMRKAYFDVLYIVALETNKKFADRFGINVAAAITCNKPAGNSSVFFNTASGMHPRYAEYYIRRVTTSINSSIGQFLMQRGVKCEPVNGVDWSAAQNVVFEFLVEARGAKTRNSMSTQEMLDLWLDLKVHWCEHNPSATIYYDRSEVEMIGNWLFDHQDKIGGITFLPRQNTFWKQAPYEEISEEEYERLSALAPKIDWKEFLEFDQMYRTNMMQEFACVSGVCEV